MPMPSRNRRKPKAQPQEEHIPESIFDVLNANPPGGKDADQKADTKGKASGPSLEELQKQLTELHTRLEQSERANMALSAPQPQPVQQQLKEPELNVENLPDPVMNPKEYGAEYGRRLQAHNSQMDEYRKAKQAQTQPSGNSEQLWEDFATSYGAYADDQEGIEFAVAKVIKQASRRGVDANRYMYQNSDRFFRDVVKVYDERFGKPDGEEELDTRNSARPRGPQPRQRGDEDDRDEGRTQGIFGGIDSSGSRRVPGPPPGDMIKDLQDIQRKTGYY